MADNSKYAQLQPFSLAGSGVSIGATTITLTSFTSIDGVPLTMSNFGDKGYGTLEPNSYQREEQICFTGITQNANGTATLTGVSTVDFLYPYTEAAGVNKSHPGGVTFVITNTSGYYNRFANKENEETISQRWTFPSLEANRPQLTSDVDAIANEALITHGELARASFAGTVNASTVQKGIVELSNLDEQDDGTSVGGTGAFLVPQNSNMTEARMNIVRFTAGEDIDASTVPLAVYIKESDGRVYKLDASAAGEAVYAFIGFAVLGQNITTGNTIRIQINGKVSGFTGLTSGAYYYATNVAGTINTTSGTIKYQVGRANSTTTLLIQPGTKTANGYFETNSTETKTITVGFKATKIIVFAKFDSATSMWSNGQWTESYTNYCIYVDSAGDIYVGTDIFHIEVNVANKLVGDISNVTGTTFDFNIVETGAIGDCGIIWMAEGN